MRPSRTTIRAVSARRIGTVLIFAGVLFVFMPAQASMTSVYVGQTASGSANGSSCANELSAAFFNSAGNWGTGSAQIGPGTTVHLCGTITSPLAAHGNGSASSPVTVVWESGASLSACSTTGAFQLGSVSHLILDLGGNSAAIICPDNGTSLVSQVDAIGVGSGGYGWNNIEIRNGAIGPMYVYSGTADNGFSSICINGGNAANNTYIHHVSLSGCAEGMEIDPNSNSTDQFSFLNIDSTVGRVLNYASGSSSNINLANSSFHDNNIDFSTVWAVPGGYEHYEAIHLYNTGNPGSQDKISNFQLYNNSFHGASPTNSGSTALIFVGEGGSSCVSTSTIEVKMFNNLITDTGSASSGFSSGTGAYFYTQDCEHIVSIYNNSINAGGTSNACFRALNTVGTTGNSWTVENNICENAHWAFLNDVNEPLTSDYNDFYNIGSGRWSVNGTTYSSLSNWQATGRDMHSLGTNPGLNSNYTIASGSSSAYSTGKNLSGLSIAALDVTAPLTMGSSGSCGSECIPRSSSGAWDLGVYTLAGSSGGTPPSPPSNLAAVVQ